MKKVKKEDLILGNRYYTTPDKESCFKLMSIKDVRYYLFVLIYSDEYFYCDENGLYSFSGDGWYSEDFKFGKGYIYE